MAKEGQAFEQWLRGAKVLPEELSDQQQAVLQAVFHFFQAGNRDYATSRIAGYFLLRCNLGLKVAQIARLMGITDRSASRHRKLSARQVVQQIQHRFAGRPYGKLLPRHAGSIAAFLFAHPKATRDELLDFIGRTWNFRVSKVALWEFLRKYGLDRANLDEARQTVAREEDEAVTARVLDFREPGALVPVVPDRFFLPIPSMPGPSSCGPRCKPGWPQPASASATTTARSSGAS
jgi:transposase